MYFGWTLVFEESHILAPLLALSPSLQRYYNPPGALIVCNCLSGTPAVEILRLNPLSLSLVITSLSLSFVCYDDDDDMFHPPSL